MTLRVSWLSSVMGNQPLWLRGSSFVSSWTDHKDRLGSCINRLGGGGGGGTIALHVCGSFVLKPQKQVTHCLTNTYSLDSHANKHTHTHTQSERTKAAEARIFLVCWSDRSAVTWRQSGLFLCRTQLWKHLFLHSCPPAVCLVSVPKITHKKVKNSSVSSSAVTYMHTWNYTPAEGWTK